MTATENYFKAKATSFRQILVGGYNEHTKYVDGVNAYLIDGEWVRPDGRIDLCQSYPDFKKWVLEKMPNCGSFSILANYWYWWLVDGSDGKNVFEEIKDNEILEAAVVAATRYWDAFMEVVDEKAP